MYVQHWRANTDAATKKGPVILIHGGSHTGVGWTTTPDGRPGWALSWIQKGWDVYVVDWPGVGRSGTYPKNVSDTPTQIIDTLDELLKRVGPAALVGHSIGAALAIKLAERTPASIRALALMAPASVESIGKVVPPTPVDRLSGTTREGAHERFANALKFPKNSFEAYFSSLVLYGPKIRNAAIGITDELKVDRTKTILWNKSIPVLMLAGEDDRTVPLSRMNETAKAMSVPLTQLGRDWKLPGHGHLFIVESDTELISNRVEQWLSKATDH